MQDDRQIIVSPSLIHAPKVVAMPYGMTIRQIVDRANPAGEVVVEVDGAVVPEDRWDYAPPDKAHVMISVPMHGGGGKNPFRIILMIAVMAAAFYVGAGLMAMGGFFEAGSMSAMFAATGVMTAGSMLVNAIAPVRIDSQKKSTEDSNTYSISGAQNKSNPWGTVPVVLGRHRMYPPFGADPYTEIADGDEYLNLLLIWGYSAITVEDLKIGDTNLSQFLGVEFQITDDHTTDPITMFPSTVHQESIGIELLQKNGPTIQTATPNVDRLSVDLVFPNGLAVISNSGDRTQMTVRALIQYRELPSGSWVTAPTTSPFYVSGTTRFAGALGDGWYSIYVDKSSEALPGHIHIESGTDPIVGAYRIGEFYVNTTILETCVLTDLTELHPAETSGFALSIYKDNKIRIGYGIAGAVETTLPTFTEQKTEAVRRSFTWDVDRTKSYEVAVSRITEDVDADQTVDAMFWTNLRSIKNDDPLANFKQPLTAMALRIKATDQLNGVIDDLNGIVTSRVNIWDAAEESWWISDWTESSNPAALFFSVLTHYANARPRTIAQIDWQALGAWYEFCDTNGYEFNQIRDFQAGIWDTLADIAAAGRASPTLMEGKWSVVYDTGDQAVVHHITQRNSWGFSAEKILFNPPHAFRVKFVNEDNGFKDDERIVYDDGYTSVNATLFEQIEFPGITSPDLIWKFGRFHIAQARLRPETYSLYQDFEHLICKRGDKVRVSHDVPLWGVGAGRVKSLTLNEAETHITAIVLDEKVTMETGKTYCCRFRRHSDDVLLSIVTAAGESATLTLTTEVPIANGPEVGDLAMFGETNNETVELLVQSVVRSSDFTAQIFMVDAAPAIYTADRGTIPAFDPHITKPIDVTRIAPTAPTVISVVSGDIALEHISPTLARTRMIINLSSTSTRVPVAKYRVRYRISDVELSEQRAWLFAEAPIEAGAVCCTEVITGTTYEWQAQAISVWGVMSEWTTLDTETIVGKFWPPGDVADFTVTQYGAISALAWTVNEDAVKYEVRLNGDDWETADIMVVRSDSPYEFPTPMEPGDYTYRIKAIDAFENYSENEATAVLTIEYPCVVENVLIEDVSTDVGVGGAVTCTVRVSWDDRPASELVIDYDVIYRETEES